MAIRLDKHLPDKSKEKNLTVYKLALWIIVAIILAVTIPKSVRYLRVSIANAAKSKAEKAYTLFMVENAANIDDYTIFVVYHNNRYYAFWYMDKVKGIVKYNEPKNFELPFEVSADMKYPFKENPFCNSLKLSDNGVWITNTEINTEAGFESFGFNKDKGVDSVRYVSYDIQDWREKPVPGVEIYETWVNGTIPKEVDDEVVNG